jgi:hypothetical protein
MNLDVSKNFTLCRDAYPLHARFDEIHQDMVGETKYIISTWKWNDYLRKPQKLVIDVTKAITDELERAKRIFNHPKLVWASLDNHAFLTFYWIDANDRKLEAQQGRKYFIREGHHVGDEPELWEVS